MEQHTPQAVDFSALYQRRGASSISRTELLLNLVWAWQSIRGHASHLNTNSIKTQIFELLSQIAARLPAIVKGRRIDATYLELVQQHWQSSSWIESRSASVTTLPFAEHNFAIELLQGFGLLDEQQEPKFRTTEVTNLLDEKISVHPQSELDIETLMLIQQGLISKIAERQICIEANPASNLLIGRYNSYADLPYKQLVDQRLSLSINTDDPGLFLTTLPQEPLTL